jgi:hypothetical protein
MPSNLITYGFSFVRLYSVCPYVHPPQPKVGLIWPQAQPSQSDLNPADLVHHGHAKSLPTGPVKDTYDMLLELGSFGGQTS